MTAWRSSRTAVRSFTLSQYLLGNQTRDQLERFRGFGGAQSYPSRTKDRDDVDISTGSVGMGVAMTSFAALAQEYLRKRQLIPDDRPPGRMIALAGDAEFDEGNIFEALLEAWKHQVTNVWWIIDYNRQSLDAIVADRFFNRLDTVFKTMEWPWSPEVRQAARAGVRPPRRRRVAEVDRRLPQLRVLGPRVSGRRPPGGADSNGTSGTRREFASCLTNTMTPRCPA